MVKVFIVLLLGLALESAGVVLLRAGLKGLPSGEAALSWEKVQTITRHAGTSWRIWVGMLCEALYFFSLLYLLSNRGLSFVWPLTSLGFVMTALAARLFLQEEIGWVRWSGIFLIMIGAGLVTYTEQQRDKRDAVKGGNEQKQMQAGRPAESG